MHPEKSRAVQAYLVASARSRRSTRVRPGCPLPFLTLSREAGAGGHSLGERLVELLNRSGPDVPWTLFDDNLVHEVLRTHDLPSELARYMPEDRVAEITDYMETVLGLHPPGDVLVGKVNSTIISIARLGHAVLVGRGSHVLTRALSGGLHVRLVAPLESRCETLMNAESLSRSRAMERLQALDAGRRAYVKRHCGEDVTDPLGYDLVVNASTQSTEAIAQMLAGRLVASDLAHVAS